MAANIKGEIPNLLPVLKEKKEKPKNSLNHNHVSEMTLTKLVKAEYLPKTQKSATEQVLLKLQEVLHSSIA